MSLEALFDTALHVNRPTAHGGPYEIVVETFAGGNLTVPDTKHRNPITRLETARGGLASRENITLTVEADAAFMAAKPAVEASARRNDPVAVLRQQINASRERVGKLEVYTGKLTSVNPPDSGISSDDVAMFEIEIACDETAG